MTKTDKIFAALFTASALLTIYGFFGLTGLAVIGTVIAVIALIAVLGWINEKTGGALGFFLIFNALSD